MGNQGFGIDTELASEIGTQITKAANEDSFITMYLYDNLHGPFYMGMPLILDGPMSQFANAFTNAYSALLAQRQAIGDALSNTATESEMAELTIAKEFHTLSPSFDAPS